MENVKRTGIRRTLTQIYVVPVTRTARTLGMGSSIHSIESLEHVDGSVEVADIPQDIKDLVDSADGFAEVMPEHKFKVVEILQDQGNIVGMTGDGVNDAPALKVANIGIAVEGSTDAARGAADIVLTEPGLSVIIDAMVSDVMVEMAVWQPLLHLLNTTHLLAAYRSFRARSSSAFATTVFSVSQERSSSSSSSSPRFSSIPTIVSWGIVFLPLLFNISVLTIVFHTDFPHLAKNTPRHIYLPVIAIVLITLLKYVYCTLCMCLS